MRGERVRIASLRECASDSYSCKRQRRRTREIHGEQKEAADWIMGKKRRNVPQRREGAREKIRDRERRGGEREILRSNIKVRLMLPRGGADIRGRMSP